MPRTRCLQCRRNASIKYAEVTVSDGRLTYWHHPQVCGFCLRLLCGILEAHEMEPVTFGPLPLFRIEGVAAR
jgi:hypothetical protein